MNNSIKTWTENRFLGFLFLIALIMLLCAQFSAAYDAEILITTADLPFSDTVEFDISGEINQTMHVSYDNWLSGQDNILFEDPLYQLMVDVSIPDGIIADNYTRLVLIEDNITQIEKIVFIGIEEVDVFPDHDEDGYTSDVDCDDEDPDVNPGMLEIYYNEKDDDCNPDTNDNFNFYTQLSKTNINIGQSTILTIYAINNSNVSVEICEDGQGFVPCYGTIDVPNSEFPFSLQIPHINVVGSYIITTTMQYNNVIRVHETSYTVSNSMTLSVQGETYIDKGGWTEIAAVASGGIIPYTYKWKLPGGGIRTGPVQNFTFSTSGDKIIELTVTDSKENTLKRNITIHVRIDYPVKVAVKDFTTGNAIANAKVSVRDQDKTTASNGIVNMNVPEGTHTFSIIKSGYDVLNDRLTIDEPLNITFYLIKADEDDPLVEELSPDNNSFVPEGLIEFEFSYADVSVTTCELYVGIRNSSFFMLKNTTTYNKSGTYTMTSVLSEGEYKWKIECEDYKHNQGSSDILYFTVGEAKAVVAEQKPDVAGEFLSREDRPNLLTVFYDALDRIPHFDQQQQIASDGLKFERNIKQGLKDIERFNRDMNDLSYREDITESEKNEKREDLIVKIDELYSTIPVDLRIFKHKNFVSYPTEADYLAFVENYYLDDEELDKKAMVEYLQGLQSKLSISTTVLLVTLVFPDDSTEEITLIIKKHTMANLSRSEVVLEIIPQDIANENEIVFITTARKKRSGIYAYEKPEEEQSLVYYLKKRLQIETAENLYSVILNEKASPDLIAATGHSIISFDTDMNFKGFLIFMIIVAISTYVFHHTDSFDKVKGMIQKGPSKSMHYVRVLINDALDNLEVGQYDNAKLIFSEIRLSFETLNPIDQNLVIDQITDLASQMDLAYIHDVINRCEDYIMHNENILAADEYNKMKEVFESLESREQEDVFDKIVDIHNKIQHKVL
ncbi:MAG: carboxypeptidase-like regulatory domain-containing protein [Nanoarchaeota archaeon]|nr:carboxypeptidase-like regulatory domain-containing protein [Nanoarchaeota archaeon]